MINKISEAPLRAVMKTDPIGPIHDQEMNRQRAEAQRETRAVESSAQSDAAGSRQTENDPESKYLELPIFSHFISPEINYFRLLCHIQAVILIILT